MRITDYEGGKNLSDVSIELTHEEARDLAAYLNRLLKEPKIGKAYLSEFVGIRLERELTILVDDTPCARMAAIPARSISVA